ncbi:hypothetical protein V5799_007322 [Amblyomma americanum]|uniref:Ran gtpase-activating protein n=1 Tax=Amblyomma americanum TaxID=6943 RepID=A0AAQ4DTV7_AMBAM
MDGADNHYPWRWRLEHLLRGLRSERSCSADKLKECWLVEDIASWNKALRATRLVLTQFEPGKLCLRSYDDRGDQWARNRGSGNENDGAFLLAWLPRKHPCIREVRVLDRAHIDRLSFISSVVVGPANKLQSLVLHASHRPLPERFLEAFGPPKCLRELHLTNVHISDALAPKVADVLKINGQTLHSVKLVGNLLSRESASSLFLALFACKRLEELTLQDYRNSFACDAMTVAFKSTRFLQKLSLGGLCETRTVSKLCLALPSNSTLRSLVLPQLSSRCPFLQEKNSTLEQLRLECPGRVQFYLFVDAPSAVPETLEQALGFATKVKISHSGLDGKVLCSVYASLASIPSLRSLHVDYGGVVNGNDGTTEGDISSALCAALKACACLQSFHLEMRRAYDEREETAPLMAQIFDALMCNPRLRKLKLDTSRLTLKTAQWFSVLVPKIKRSLVELRIGSTGNIPNAVLGVLKDIIIKNVFLSRVTVRCSVWEDVVWACAAIDDAKEQNQGLLNKAAKFVMSLDGRPTPCAKHSCASAFDELCGTASLKEHLVSLYGKSERQVSMDVNKARCYVDDNYMIYAGVVRARVLCEAGDGSTQLDQLNVDCWRSIVQYLKLSDVVS